MEDLIKIVKSLEDSDLLLKGVVWETEVAGSKRQNEKLEILLFKNYRVLKKAFCTPKLY